MVTGRAGALSQVLINLINNAITHAFGESKDNLLSLGVTAEQDNVVITVQDNGVGMGREQSDQVFDKYFTTKMGDGGSGLGLFIVKSLVEDQLKGSIICESELGNGTSFIIRFPLKS